MRGMVYTETMVHSPPSAFVNEAPYQIVIVTLDRGKRVTGRALNNDLTIDDPVELAEERNGVPYFRKT